MSNDDVLVSKPPPPLNFTSSGFEESFDGVVPQIFLIIFPDKLPFSSLYFTPSIWNVLLLQPNHPNLLPGNLKLAPFLSCLNAYPVPFGIFIVVPFSDLTI